MRITSTPSPLDIGLASPPSSTSKLEVSPCLVPDAMPISKMHIFHLSVPTNIPICRENTSPACSSNAVYTYMSTVCESAINACVDGEREQRERKRDLEALMGSSLTRFLAKGTREAVKVELGIAATCALGHQWRCKHGEAAKAQCLQGYPGDCESLQSSICFHTVKKAWGVRTQEQISVSLAKCQTCTDKEF